MKKKRYKKGKLFLALFLTLVMISSMTAFATGGELSDSTLQNENMKVTQSDSGEDSNTEQGKTETGQNQENSDTNGENGTDTEKNTGDSVDGYDGGSENKEDTDAEPSNGEASESDGSSAKKDPAPSEDEQKDNISKEQDGNTENQNAGSVMPLNGEAEETAISSNEEEGIAQLATLIPDINFRTEVWRSLSVAGQLGDPNDPNYKDLTGDDLYSAVLRNFTGKIYASGYVKKMVYKLSGLQTPVYDSYEDALKAAEQFKPIFPNITVEQKIQVTDEKKPDDQLIEDITGIEYLRKADEIDLSSNRIKDLTPLDTQRLIDEYFNNPAFSDAFVVIDETSNNYAPRALFGEDASLGQQARNTTLYLDDNPIVTYPRYLPGRLNIPNNRTPGPNLTAPVIVAVKHPNQELSLTASIDVPSITIGGKEFTIIQDLVKLNSIGNTLGVSKDNLSYDSNNRKVSLSGISHSGESQVNISTINTGADENTRISYAFAHEDGTISTSSFGITASLEQQVRVLYEVLPGEPGGKAEVEFNKVAMGTQDPVSGATYRLFQMKMNGDTTIYQENDTVTISKNGEAVNQDGTVIAEPVVKGKGSSEKYIERTTDEKGQFQCQEELEAGTYCFIETESPEGYEVNTKPLIFTVAGADAVTISGGTNLTKVNFSNVPENKTYQLYVKDETGEKLYNNDEMLQFSAEDGVMQIEGLADGTYLLKDSTGTDTTEFTVSGNTVAVSNSTSGVSATGQSVNYIDRYSDDIDIQLPEVEEGLQLDSLTVSYYDENNAKNDEVFSTGTAEEIVSQAEAFINQNKGTAEKMGKIQGQVTITPVYKTTASLTAEDPKKVQFSFMKTDGNPSDDSCTGLAGATFTLYHAHKDTSGNWEYSETEDKYKEATAASDGKVNFEYIDSGDYIMKETTPPQGYASLPGYWKITADAWTNNNDQKLTFLYVGKDGTESQVPEKEIIPGDVYQNHYYIPNYKIEKLPSMGGLGTRGFKILGLLFAGAAVIVFVCARRNKRKGEFMH